MQTDISSRIFVRDSMTKGLSSEPSASPSSERLTRDETIRQTIGAMMIMTIIFPRAHHIKDAP